MGDFDKTVGVLLLGLFLNTYLYGLVTYQFIVYKNTRFNDPLWVKIVVAALFMTDTLHSAVAIYAGWEMCVTNFNHPEMLVFVGWTIPFSACATSLAAILTQFFLGHRVFLLTRSKVICTFIGILSVVGFVFGNYVGIRCGMINDARLFTFLEPFVICWLVCQTSADLIITGVLIYVLSRARTGFRETDTMINRLIRGAIQTGLFASIFVLGDLLSFLLLKETYFYAMFEFPIGRIYTNTLLDTLNARSEFKQREAGTIELGTTSNNMAYHFQDHSQALASCSLQSIQVRRDTVFD